MQLARNSFIVLACILLHGCADILPLSGGNRDTTAPKPINQQPVSGSTNVKPTEVTLEFDEYISLKDPGTSVTMSPEIGVLATSQHKKTVTVKWSGTLAEETTYILTLNGTVKDLNEGNDSIIQVVFSTGSFIDSLSYSGNIRSAYSGEKIQNATICLYATDSVPFVNQPSYYTRSNKAGDFKFEFIKNKTYTLFAFQDQNKNNKVDGFENLAFADNPINPGDTIPAALRLFKPKNAKNKLKITIEKPGTALLTGVNFDSSTIFINEENAKLLQRYNFDSVRVALPISTNDNYKFAVGTDTLVRRHTIADRKENFSIRLLNNKQVKQGDTLKFNCNESVQKIDESLITVVGEDGKVLTFETLINNGQVSLLTSSTSNFTVKFQRNAFTGIANSNDTISFALENVLPEKCGGVILDVSEFSNDWIFELIDNANTETGKVVARKHGNGSKLMFNGLIPGQYSIRCFKDENANETWDSGDYSLKKQPETMLRFPVKQKVRANWEVEEKLSPSN